MPVSIDPRENPDHEGRMDMVLALLTEELKSRGLPTAQPIKVQNGYDIGIVAGVDIDLLIRHNSSVARWWYPARRRIIIRYKAPEHRGCRVNSLVELKTGYNISRVADSIAFYINSNLDELIRHRNKAKRLNSIQAAASRLTNDYRKRSGDKIKAYISSRWVNREQESELAVQIIVKSEKQARSILDHALHEQCYEDQNNSFERVENSQTSG